MVKPRPGASSLLTVFVLAFLIAAFHWQQHTNSTLFGKSLSNVSNSLGWMQPEVVNESYPVLIHTNLWSINYADIEKALHEIKLDEFGQVIQNTQTADVLARASNYIKNDIDQENLERIALLVQKGLPVIADDTLAQLLVAYYHYRQHLDSVSQEDNSLRNREILQKKYFGAVASTQLFSEQNIIQRYLEKRHAIISSQSLDSAEKDAALKRLEGTFSNNKN